MAKKYKSINYDQYVAFINTVVSNTIQSGGLEYKRFWRTLAFAMIFENYQPKHFKKNEDGIEDNIILINEEWNEISGINIYESGYDPAVVGEMCAIIDKKLDKVFGKSEVETAIISLLESASSFINEMNERFKNENVEEQTKVITSLSDKIEGMDKKTLAAFMANYAHQEAKSIDLIKQG